MRFDDKISKEEYIEFWKKNVNQHFMNSYWWGKVQERNRNQIPCYVGVRDDKNNILCESLLLMKKTPLNMCYFYAPRGFVIDWSNKKLVNFFTNELKKYLKEKNAIYLRVDPAVSYQDVDTEANVIENGNNNYALFNELLSLGYHHTGFHKLYEGNQPRYTFRTLYNNYDSFDEVEKTISKTFMRSIKRSYNYNLVIDITNNLDEFYNLIKKVSDKDNFKAFSKEYYTDVIDFFKEEGYIKNFVAKININESIDYLDKQIVNEEGKNKKAIEDRNNKLRKDIDFLKNHKTNDGLITIASLICIYTENGAWSLYIGNDEIAEYTGAINRLYYEFMKDAYDNKKEFADLFGTVGDPKTKYKNLAGIFEYKRKLGGTLIEWMGDFDLVNKPFWYKVLPFLLKIYRKIK